MTTRITNSVIHFAKILKVYTVLALFGAGVVVVAQLGAGFRHYYSIENIALTVGIILTFTLLTLRVLVSKIKFVSFLSHIHVQAKKAKQTSEETVSPDISPRLKKS